MSVWEFWIDRGGTFTDIVAQAPDGTLSTHKLLSENPERYRDAAVQGIRACLGLNADAPLPDDAIKAVKMGTTVATNALLERRGVPVLLMITAGFRDLLEIGYQTRPRLFDLHIQRPSLLYRDVCEVAGRMDAAGAELVAPDLAQARADLQAAFDTGTRAVAIALLHAYLNPAHELALAEIARDIGFTQISLSHQVSALAKLVGRADTTVVDAYLSPILARYVDQVAGALDIGRATGGLYFMQSSGALADAASFAGKDAILSGPAGGIVGMVRTGAAAGRDRLIGFDMGGTSTDVSHYAGHFERSFETEVAGVRMRAPMMDIHTVAAGGGSICTFRDGRLQVGPESAGADPGPASYRRGGPLTVTDCNVILGRLNPEHFPAVFGPNGDEKLSVAAARSRATEIAEAVGAALGQAPEIEELAQGFLRIAVDNMANAIKKISLSRGHDVTPYTLVSFGGAGGQHACAVADALGMGTVMIHPFAGVLSAYGMGLAELAVLRERQMDCALDAAELDAAVRGLQRDADAALADQGAVSARYVVRAHLRYEGAHQPLEVEWGDIAALKSGFETAHQSRFGFTSPERAVLVDMITVEAIAAGSVQDVVRAPGQDKGVDAAAEVALIDETGPHDAPLYQRAALGRTQIITGPAIITEPTGTNFVARGWAAQLDDLGNLILTRSAAQTTLTNTDTHADTAAATTTADPILLEVMNNLFMSIADQMGATLANTSWSVNIKERLDFSCAIFDGAGDLVANAPHVPVHLGSMSDSIKVVMRQFPDARDGDAYVLNAPYNGGTHLPDVTVVTPVFLDGAARPAYWLGSRGHHADIGGRTPGSSPPDSTSLSEEGVVIEPQALMRGGVMRERDMRDLLASGRYPARAIDQNIADLKAQIAANETGRRALIDVATRYGGDVVTAYMGHVQDNAAACVAGVIRGLKSGSYVYEMDQGCQIAVAVRVDADQGRAVVDFTGTSPQQAGNYNAPLSISRAVVLYAFRCLVGKDIPLNEGCLRPLDIIVPAGSMLNPGPDAAVIAGNTEVSQAACNALMGALGAMAGSQGTMNNFVWGNAVYQNYETIAGGTGAGPGFGGTSGVQSHMTNTRMTDPEILEKRFPVRLEQFSLRPGSGGAGHWTGGDGVIRRLRFLEDVTVTVLTSHRRVAPFGGDGGAPGLVGENWVETPDGIRRRLAGNDQVDLRAGGVFEMRTPGGGGWGRA